MTSRHRTGARNYGLALAVLLATAFLGASARADILYAGTESQANRIDRITAAGAVTTFANLSAGAYFPQGLAFDSANNLFVASNNAGQISKITPAGVVSTFKALPTAAPSALAIDGANNLYTGDATNKTIIRITPAGVTSTYASLPTTDYVTGLAFGRDGRLYAADTEAHAIFAITPAGVATVFASLASDALPFGIAFDANNNLFVSDILAGTILKITPAGVTSLFATLPQDAQPLGLAFDSAGFLYEGGVDAKIRKISPLGVVTPFASGLETYTFLAFTDDAGNRLALPVPEPTFATLLIGVAAAAVRRRPMR